MASASGTVPAPSWAQTLVWLVLICGVFYLANRFFGVEYESIGRTIVKVIGGILIGAFRAFGELLEGLPN